MVHTCNFTLLTYSNIAELINLNKSFYNDECLFGV